VSGPIGPTFGHGICATCGGAMFPGVGHTCVRTVYGGALGDPVCRRCNHPRSKHNSGDGGLLCPIARPTYEAP
jgi:hypothetical protein